MEIKARANLAKKRTKPVHGRWITPSWAAVNSVDFQPMTAEEKKRKIKSKTKTLISNFIENGRLPATAAAYCKLIPSIARFASQKNRALKMLSEFPEWFDALVITECTEEYMDLLCTAVFENKLNRALHIEFLETDFSIDLDQFVGRVTSCKTVESISFNKVKFGDRCGLFLNALVADSLGLINLYWMKNSKEIGLLSKLPQLHILHVTVKNGAGFSKLLAGQKSLRQLSLNFTEQPKIEEFETLNISLRGLQEMTWLEISGQYFSDSHMSIFETSMASDGLSRLEYLSLKSWRDYARLHLCLGDCKMLRVLEIKSIGDQSKIDFSKINCPRLEALSFRDIQAKQNCVDGILQLLKNSPQISMLKMGGLDDSANEKIHGFLLEEKRKLKSLELIDCWRLNFEEKANFLKMIPGMNSMSIHNGRASGKAWNAIFNALAKSGEIMYLSLPGCTLGTKNLKGLKEMINRTRSTLRVLDLNDCLLAEDAISVIRAVEGSNLVTIDLTPVGEHLDGDDQDEKRVINELEAAMKTNRSLIAANVGSEKSTTLTSKLNKNLTVKNKSLMKHLENALFTFFKVKFDDKMGVWYQVWSHFVGTAKGKKEVQTYFKNLPDLRSVLRLTQVAKIYHSNWTKGEMKKLKNPSH